MYRIPSTIITYLTSVHPLMPCLIDYESKLGPLTPLLKSNILIYSNLCTIIMLFNSLPISHHNYFLIKITTKERGLLLVLGSSLCASSLYSSQPVGYMGQSTGPLHIYLWSRLCGRSAEEAIQIGRLCEF